MPKFFNFGLELFRRNWVLYQKSLLISPTDVFFSVNLFFFISILLFAKFFVPVYLLSQFVALEVHRICSALFVASVYRS